MTDTASKNNIAIIDGVIRARKTAKILRNQHDCEPLPIDRVTEMHKNLKEIIDVAAWAPFHKVANEQIHRKADMTSIVPWRFYVLEKPDCCKLLQFIEAQSQKESDSKWSKAWNSKIPKLLAGCSSLIQVTWLPDPPTTGDTPELTTKNIEHIAAASAAIQNLLIAAEARLIHNYWSSGGILKDDIIFDYLGIPLNQMLLGSIFLTHPEQNYDENQSGSLRHKRGEVSDWSKWVRL